MKELLDIYSMSGCNCINNLGDKENVGPKEATPQRSLLLDAEEHRPHGQAVKHMPCLAK